MRRGLEAVGFRQIAEWRIREIDDHAIGAGGPGEVTRVLQDAFQDVLYGRNQRYLDWLDVVPVTAKPAATVAGQAVGEHASA